jgi:hypothetical protein
MTWRAKSARPYAAAAGPPRKTNPLSVLQRATIADVRLEPFPHLVIKDALPAPLYAQLARPETNPMSLKILFIAWNRNHSQLPKITDVMAPEVVAGSHVELKGGTRLRPRVTRSGHPSVHKTTR